MSTKPVSTRRRFIGAGVALSAPLAATAALAGKQDEDAPARLAELEATNAVRALQREYARLVNAGARAQAAQLFATPAAAAIDARVSRLAADRFAMHETIDVAQDGKMASARLECVVETATALTGVYTLIDMLNAQGEGSLRATQRRVLETDYVKDNGVWRIARLALLPA
jgi:hypothetical protein